VPLDSRSTSTGSSPLLPVTTTTRRRKNNPNTQQIQSQREEHGSLLRREEHPAKLLLLASTAGQKKLHRVPQKASPLPLASMAGQGGLRFAAPQHQQQLRDNYFIDGDGGSLLARMLRPPET
jgi:hypothetical protein